MGKFKLLTPEELDEMDWNDLLELHMRLSEQLDLVDMEIDNRI